MDLVARAPCGWVRGLTLCWSLTCGGRICTRRCKCEHERTHMLKHQAQMCVCVCFLRALHWLVFSSPVSKLTHALGKPAGPRWLPLTQHRATRSAVASARPETVGVLCVPELPSTIVRNSVIVIVSPKDLPGTRSKDSTSSYHCRVAFQTP